MKDTISELFNSVTSSVENIEDINDLPIPKLCSRCIVATICSPLNNFVSLDSIGIKLEIASCSYYKPIPKASSDKPGTSS